MTNRNFAKYLEEIAQASAWGSALEVTAFAMTHDRPVYIFCPGQEQKNFLFNRNGKRKPLFLKYDAAAEHYSCLVPDQTFQCPEDVIDGPHAGLRGAASSTGTRSSVRRRLQKTAASLGTSHAASKCLKAPSVGTRATIRQMLGPAEVSSSSSTLPSEIWTCNLCGYDVRARTPDLCSKYRCKHIRNVHPGVSLDQFHKRSAAATLVEPARRRVEDAVWQCANCKLTLPAMDRKLLARSAKAHLKKCMPKAKLTLRQNQQRLRKGHTVHKIRFQNLTKAARLAKMRQLDENINEASTATGHKLEKIMFPALTWKSDVIITCQTCTRFFRCLKEARDSKQCPGVDGSHGRRRKWMRKGNWWALARMKHTAELHHILQVWKPTATAVLQLENMMKPSTAKKCPPLTSNVWVRSLLDDGDIEPNPGPQRGLLLLSTQVALKGPLQLLTITQC